MKQLRRIPYHGGCAEDLMAEQMRARDFEDQRDALAAKLVAAEAKHEDEIRRLNGGDWLRERPMIELLLSDREGLRAQLAAMTAARDELADKLDYVLARYPVEGVPERVGELRKVGAP